MKKIDQGKYEVFTTKEDAIKKFRQMQGVCRGEISGDRPIEFYCSKKGKIAITNPPQRHAEHTNSTKLFAEVTEQDGKTYVAYHTEFSKVNNVLKLILMGFNLLLAVFGIIFAIISAEKQPYFIIFIVGSLFFTFQLFTGANESRNSPKDSETMIKELEKRVEAVNLWDK